MDKVKLLQDLQQAEGCRETAYKDTRGFWTAGYGHLLDQSKDWTGIKFDSDTISGWLSNDVDNAAARAAALVEWPSLDTDARQNAVVELVFNMGVGTWRQFAHTRLCLQHKEWDMAYSALLDSAWAHEVQPRGFDKPGRATRIADYIRTGEFGNA